MIRSSRALRVCVLAGGDSPERDISLASGRSVARSLTVAGHRVSRIDPRPLEQLLACHSGSRAAAATDAEFLPALWDQIDWLQFDACFLALHGGAGEDGRLQEFLQCQGVAFTGSAADAARTAMSKSASKDRFCTSGVPTPEYRLFGTDASFCELVESAASIGYPLVTKPDSQGSSLGITLVKAVDQLAEAAHESLRYDLAGIMEAFVDGREFTVAVLDREPLPLVEVCSRTPIFSYAEKYDASAPHYRFDTGLPMVQQRAIVDAAVAAATSLATDGLVRIDLRVDAQGQPWVLELNSTPGMTETSLAPAAARRAGLDMPELCNLVLDRCLERKNSA